MISTLTSAVAIFPTYDAPHYDYGYQILILFGGLAIIGSSLLYLLQGKEEHKTAPAVGSSSTDEEQED